MFRRFYLSLTTPPLCSCASDRRYGRAGFVSLSWVMGIVAATLCVLGSPVNAVAVSTPEAVFIKGKSHLDQNNLKDAEAVWRALFKDEHYGPVALILLARGHRRTRDFAKSELLYNESLKNFPKGIYAEVIKRELVGMMVDQGKADAIPLLRELIENTHEKRKSSLILSLARLQNRLGHYAEAADQYKKLYLQFPASIEGLHAAEEISSLTVNGKITRLTYTEREQTGRARLLYNAGRFDLAGDVYEALLRQHPSDKLLQLKLATCRYKERKNQSAINILKAVLKGDPSLSVRLESWYLLSRLYWRLDKDKDFELYSQKLVESGTRRFKRIALFNLGTYHFEKGRYEAARTYFDRVIKLGPDDKMRFQLKWRMAWTEYLTNDFSKAANLFRELKTLASSMNLQNACLYWQARSLVKSNKNPEAVKLLREVSARLPMSYYGYESADLLKTIETVPEAHEDQANRFPDVTLKPLLGSDARIQQAIKLQELKLNEFALINLDSLPSRMQAEPAIALLRARCAYLLGQYVRARSALACAFGKFMESPPKDAPREFVEIAFPRVHYEETLRQAARHSLDPNLVWSIIRQESLYDESAVSPAGALGLMQVTPEASGLTRIAGKPSNKVITQLLDPQQNLAIGTKILKRNMTAFGGNVVTAVASYNADIRKVKSWIRNNSRLKPDEFIEMIPYQETRTYVKSVLAGYRTYRVLHSRRDIAELW